MTYLTTGAMPGESLTAAQRLGYILILGALTALGPFTIDLYLPALPEIEVDLLASTEAVQLTLAGTTIGFALGNLIVGPISDRIGRKLPLVLATTLHIFASLGLAVADDIIWLNILRVIQGFGAAAGGVVAMAMVRDLFTGKPLVQMLSRLSLVNGVAPIAAPVIGSQMLLVTDWHGIFAFLGIYGLVIVILAAVLIRETLPPGSRKADDTGFIAKYRAVLSDRLYLGVLFVGAMNFVGLFAYLSASSFLFQDTYRLNAQEYGLLFGLISVGTVAGVQISSRLAQKFGPQRVLLGTTVAKLLAALAVVVFEPIFGFLGAVIPLWFFIAFTGMTFPLVQVLALLNHGKQAGTAASFLGAVNFGTGGLITPIVGLIGVLSATPIAWLMSGAAVLAIIVIYFVVRPASANLEGFS